MEYLLITAFAFLLLAPIIIIAYSQSASFSNDVAAAQVERLGSQITDAINAAYYAGPPSKQTMALYFPDRIDSITIAGNTIVFAMQGAGGKYEYAASAAGNITGTLRPFEGIHRITITATAAGVNITDEA